MSEKLVKIFTGKLVDMLFMRSALNEQGVAFMIKNVNLTPLPEVYSGTTDLQELWVFEEDSEKVIQIIQELETKG